jgi:prepilin-type processing-associated H-X9-DG protein
MGKYNMLFVDSHVEYLARYNTRRIMMADNSQYGWY